MPQSAVMSAPSHRHASHLTDQQSRTLRTALTERLLAHRDRAAQASTALDDLTGAESPDERELAQGSLQGLRDAIHEHEVALERVEAGTYGLCGSCGRPIPFERLEAIPEVDRCIGCVGAG